MAPLRPPRPAAPERRRRRGRRARIDRRYYELCVLWELRAALRAGDVWLEGSRRYADPETYLLYAAVFAQACNFGLGQLAAIAGLSYRRLAWCATWYLREETLKAAVARVVDFQYRQPLARAWGGGTLSSSDGQRFPVAVKARTAAALPRYFGLGRGVTHYTWTSDQFAPYGAKVIPSTVRDATYVLDEILDNETELPLEQHTTDTHTVTWTSCSPSSPSWGCGSPPASATWPTSGSTAPTATRRPATAASSPCSPADDTAAHGAFAVHLVADVALPELAAGYAGLVRMLRAHPELQRIASERGAAALLDPESNALDALRKGDRELVTAAGDAGRPAGAAGTRLRGRVSAAVGPGETGEAVLPAAGVWGA